MSEDYGNCDSCGTALVLAPGIDTYCPNKACKHDYNMMIVGMRKQMEYEERKEYERLKAKYAPPT